MANISNEDRRQYNERIKPYRLAIQSLTKRGEEALEAINKSEHGGALKRLALAEEMMNLASQYIVLNGVSWSMLRHRNEEALNNSRKALFKAILHLEEVVSPLVDAPFSEYEEKLAEIAGISAKQRYTLVRKMGLTINLLQNAYGHNTKWKWAFVEMEGRYAAIAKNIIDLKTVMINSDPRSPNYEPTVLHLRLIKKLLHRAASRYRDKYELSTDHVDDFNMGIRFLDALRRLYVLLGDRADAETIKKKTGIWTTKMQTDIKKKEEDAAAKSPE